MLEASERWWVASAWLWLMVFFNLLSAALLLVALDGHLSITKTPALGQIYGLAAGVLQIACVAAIFRWHRWGWWGLLLIGLMTFFVNVTVGHPLVLSLAGLVGVGLTFLVLKGGGRLAVWPRLK